MNGHSDDIDYAPMPDDDDEMYVAMRYDEWLAGKLAAAVPDDYRIFNRRQADGTFRPLSEYFDKHE